MNMSPPPLPPRSPVEVHTRYATSTETLAEAWAFVMDRIDKVGPDPAIEINPCWFVCSADMTEPRRHFSVVVSGAIEEDDDE